MTKSGLIEKVAELTPHVSKKDTEIVVNTIFDAMTEALKQGERIEIRGFGSFQVKVREAREGRNPKTGEEVQIPAKRTPFFKVGGRGRRLGRIEGQHSGRATSRRRAECSRGASCACCVVCWWWSCSERCSSGRGAS